ncbi:MAG: FUSC family protein [Solirubrobacteraceae bacterium]
MSVLGLWLIGRVKVLFGGVTAVVSGVVVGVKSVFVSVVGARVQGRLWPIGQTALAAVAAWYVAVLLGVDSRPGFASIAAVISLGAAFGERRQRAVQLIFGVMLGIVLADLLVRTIGYGLPQIGALVVLAMLAAVILGGSELLITEAAVSAILVATLSSTPEVRLLEVLIGGGVAIAVHALVFPPDPRIGVRRAASAAFGELGAVLRDGAAALAAGDVREAESASRAAESLEKRVAELRHGSSNWAGSSHAARASSPMALASSACTGRPLRT